MGQRKHHYYTPEDIKIIWDHYKNGSTQHDIARLFNTSHSSIGRILTKTGGYRPPVRRRSPNSLTLSEREEISRSITLNRSIRCIAYQLDRSPSTISREIERNGGYDNYRAVKADKRAWDKALRPKHCKLFYNPKLCRVIEGKLKHKWSPQQISEWLKLKYPNDESKHVTHETIYKSLFIQSRGTFKKEFQSYLRSNRTIRRGKTSSLKGKNLGKITNAISISERPPSIEDRAVPGHWEGDLIIGTKIAALPHWLNVTLVM